MRSGILVAGSLLALFIIGWFRVAGHDGAPEHYRLDWVARRNLAGGHQISPGDLAYPGGWLATGRLLLREESVQGKHLAGVGRKAGERIDADEIASRPDLTPRSANGHIYFYVLKEDTTPSGGWTEGASVIGCYKSRPGGRDKELVKCVHTPLPIRALHIASTTSEASWLAIEVPEKARCTFAEFALAEKRLLFQVSAPLVESRGSR